MVRPRFNVRNAPTPNVGKKCPHHLHSKLYARSVFPVIGWALECPKSIARPVPTIQAASDWPVRGFSFPAENTEQTG